ncbi:hypothetical protein GJ496_011499 [Pomphorhynchus laevis]|nr:hypothetical protein GJ496_011499 [Pomphorhynchus laevis]
MERQERGVLIAFEGIDRVGKTTQVDRLVHTLRAKHQRHVEKITFPNRSTLVGRLIHAILQGAEPKPSQRVMHMLFSANRWELVERIKNALKDRKVVVMDRYAYSGLAYSLAAEECIPVSWLFNCDSGLPEPDLTIYLDGNPTYLLNRTGYGTEILENIEYQERVRNIYLTLVDDPKWHKVDTEDRNLDEIEESIYSKVMQLLRNQIFYSPIAYME